MVVQNSSREREEETGGPLWALLELLGSPVSQQVRGWSPGLKLAVPNNPSLAPRCSSPAQVTKAKIDELDHIKIKYVCASKDTISRMKGNLQNRGKYPQIKCLRRN